jgi:hypothetical protein
MAHILANLVKQTSLSGGLTTITLTGQAVSPNRNFSVVLSNGDTTEAMVVDQSTGAWQNAVYSYADNVLTFVSLRSSSTGAQVDFPTGYKTVYIAPVAEREEAYQIPFDGAVLRTMSDRLGDKLHLDDFLGEVETAYDGTDDTTSAWVDAIAAADEAGRTLVVPRSGTYKITDELDVPSGVRIELSAGVIVRQATEGRGAFVINGDNVAIEGNGGTIEYAPAKTLPADPWLGDSGWTRMAAVYCIGANPTVHNIRADGWLVAVYLRGPVVTQVLSTTGYDHSSTAKGLSIENIVGNDCDHIVRGAQYEGGHVWNLQSFNETIVTGNAAILSCLNLAEGAYAGVIKSIDFRGIYKDGITGTRVIGLSGAVNCSLDDVVIANPATNACIVINVGSGASNTTIGPNVRLVGLKDTQFGIQYSGSSNCRDVGVYFEGATNQPFIAARANSSATNIVSERPQVVTNFTTPNTASSQQLFRAISSASYTVRNAQVRHLQANTMFVFGADSATIKAIWPTNIGNTAGYLLRLDGSATGLLRCYAKEIDNFNEFDLTSITNNGTLTKDILLSYSADKVWFPAGTSAATIQAAIVAESTLGAGKTVHLGPGTHTLASTSATGGGIEPACIGYAAGGDGLKVTLIGAGKYETTLIPSLDCSHIMRFAADDPTTPITVVVKDMTLDYGAITTLTPIAFVKNAIYHFENVRFIAAWDMTAGGGLSGNGSNRGKVIDCEFICCGINFGGGAEGGGRLPPTEENRPFDHQFIRNRLDCFPKHGINCHTAQSVLIALNNAEMDTGRFGAYSSGVCYRGGNGGTRMLATGNTGKGKRALFQFNDYDQLTITSNIGIDFWSSAIIVGQKNNIVMKNVVIAENNLDRIGRLLGRETPASVIDDDGDGDDTNESNFFQAQSAIAIYGGTVGSVHGNTITSDVPLEGWGRIIAVKGDDEITIVDDAWLGKNNTGASFLAKGDPIQVNGFTLGYISTASDAFGDRVFYDDLNGDGTQIGSPIPYGDDASGVAVSDGSMVMTVKLDAGAAFDVGDIADLGNAALQAGTAWTFTHLRQEYIRTGKHKDAPTTGGETFAWVPMEDWSYFIPGPTGSTISITAGSTTITGSGGGSPALLDTTMSIALDAGVPIDIAVLVSGRWVFGCTLLSIGSETAATAYSDGNIDGAVRTATNVSWAWIGKQKMRSGGYIGYFSADRNRARKWRYDPNQAIEGWFGSRFRLYYESMAEDGFPSVLRDTAAWTGSSATDIDFFRPPEKTGFQAIWRWKYRLLGAVTGTVSLLLQVDDGAGGRTTLKTVVITGAAAGEYEETWDTPVNDGLPDGNGLDPDAGEYFVLRASPTGSATVPRTMHDYRIGPW